MKKEIARRVVSFPCIDATRRYGRVCSNPGPCTPQVPAQPGPSLLRSPVLHRVFLLVDWLVRRLVDWLACWFAGRRTGWLVGLAVG